MRDRQCFLCGKEGAPYTEIDFERVRILCYLCSHCQIEGCEEKILAKIAKERK